MNLVQVIVVLAIVLQVALLTIAYMLGRHVANEKWINRHHGPVVGGKPAGIQRPVNQPQQQQKG